MKALLYFLVCCMPVLLHAQSDSNYKGIRFEQALTWEQIKAKAAATNKYIFVDCYATWCSPCKMMDRNVYPAPHVGAALNDHFISVKVQMDSTTEDDDQTKKWYASAQKMLRDYKINAFPTYLFFSPDGNLIHRGIGVMNSEDFIHLSELARDPQKILFYHLYRQYKQNKKEYPTMGELALFTRDLIGDRFLSHQMARDFKENYLDTLDLAELYTKKHVDFICSFKELVHTNDKFFLLCYQNPQKFDSIRGTTGLANEIVAKAVSREISTKVLKNGKALEKTPDWEQVEATIAKKYNSVDARKLVLNYKIGYYRAMYKDWKLWAKYKDEMVKAYPPQPPYGLDVYMDINGHGGAWHAFLYCSDTIVLQKALEWIDIAIKLDGENKYHRAAYIDTKANLLYKLGKRQEALILEKEAIALSAEGDNAELLEAYKKMQRGEPTWSTQ